MVIQATDGFRARHPGARLGILTMTGVSNPASHPGLEARKGALEEDLKRRYAGFDRKGLKDLPVLKAYDAYYRKFDKSYHVLLQIESVALKGKPLPRVAALVEAMFMAELDDLILTAGHDMSALKPPLVLDAASAGEGFTGMNGKPVSCAPGDMRISDSEGIISAVLHGPDSRTRIMPETSAVLFTAYAPEGVGEEAVRAHMEKIRDLVKLFSPDAATVEIGVVD